MIFFAFIGYIACVYGLLWLGFEFGRAYEQVQQEKLPTKSKEESN